MPQLLNPTRPTKTYRTILAIAESSGMDPGKLQGAAERAGVPLWRSEIEGDQNVYCAVEDTGKLASAAGRNLNVDRAVEIELA